MPGFLVGIVIGAVAMAAYSKKGGTSLSSTLSSLGGRVKSSYRDTTATGGRVDEFSSAAQSPISSENMSSVNAGDGTPSGSRSGSAGSGSANLGQPLSGSGTGSGQSPAAGLAEGRF